MKIHNVTQGTEAWLACRAGIPTASELGSIVSPIGAIREGKGVKTYVAHKLAERWLGYPMQSFAGGYADQGKELEGEAIPWIESEFKIDIQRVGFISTDDGSFGCSPDGLHGDEGYEIKCNQPPNHVKWLLAGVVPEEHILQCQGGLYATGARRWMFVSYCRGFPPLVVPVPRNDKLIADIAEAVRICNDEIAAGWAKLVAKNGGRVPKRAPIGPPPPPADDDPFATRDDPPMNLRSAVTDQHFRRETT